MLRAYVGELNAEFYGPHYAHAHDYLTERGFWLDPEMRWHAPHAFKFTPKDFRAMAFLAAEWGYSAAIIDDPEVIPPRSRQH